MSIVGAVDVGGTTTRAAVIDDSGMRAIVRAPTTNGEMAVNTINTCLHNALGQARVRASELAGIGVSIPGPLTADRRCVAFTGNVNLRHHPVAALIEQEFKIPVQMDDDANAATLAEAHLGAGRAASVVFMMVVGTGIGGGLVIDGELFRGAHSMAGELGHIPVQPDGPLCSCGAFGCLEAVAAGPALAARGRAALARGASTALADMSGHDAARITAEMVLAAADRGDACALRAVTLTGQYVGMGAAAVASLFDPDIVVLGGGLGRQSLIATSAAAEVAGRCIPPINQEVKVITGELGDDAGLWGAAMLTGLIPSTAWTG